VWVTVVVPEGARLTPPHACPVRDGGMGRVTDGFDITVIPKDVRERHQLRHLHVSTEEGQPVGRSWHISYPSIRIGLEEIETPAVLQDAPYDVEIVAGSTSRIPFAEGGPEGHEILVFEVAPRDRQGRPAAARQPGR
jgi:hypothetical protein